MNWGTIEQQRKYYELEQVFEWRKWSKEIPAIKFPPHWNVKIVPPFAAAMIRFWVTLDDMVDGISVYLDCYETLGCWDGQPYWEIHPCSDGDCARYDMTDVKGLLEGIEEALNARIKKNDAAN